VANKEDLQIARELGQLEEWRKQANKRLDDHHKRIEGVETWQKELTNLKRAALPLLTAGALAGVVLCCFGFLLYNPSLAKQIASLLGELIKAAK